jgi:hypothetical protein
VGGKQSVSQHADSVSDEHVFMLGPDSSGVPAAPASEVLALLKSSWGRLAQDGYCMARNACGCQLL